MAPSIKSFNDEILDVKKQSLYARLKKLFSSDVIVRNVGGKQLKIKDTDNAMYATDRNSLHDRFNRIRSTAYNSHSRDFALSYQAARMDLFRDYDCVGPDTIIPLPNGSRPTIKELSEQYKDKPQERFYVFSYDHETDSIKLGNAYHPRLKGMREGFKVTFDNGQYIIGSIKHPFLMRDGTYKKIFDLKVGDSVMPFYQSNYGYGKHNYKQYRRLYNFSQGYQPEHKIIAEQFQRKVLKNEVIHHKNFDGSDNSPDNLDIMDWKTHKTFHSNHNKTVLWGPNNYQNQLKKLLTNENYINRVCHKWNGERSGENNPLFGKQHSDESNEIRSKTLKKVFINRNQSDDKNPKYRDDLTIETLKTKAIEYYKENGKLTSWGFVKNLGCDYSVLQNRLKKNNIDWKSFKNEIESTLNHKITSIEHIGSIEVYDMTVDIYHNFATDNCFVSNSMDMDPILNCLSGDTYVSTLTGFITIKELSEKYRGDETFSVWSWDNSKSKLTIGTAHHARKTGTKEVIELHLDNKQVIKCTEDHRIMLIDGTYKMAGELKNGESLMPFYHSFDKTHEYQMIKSLGKLYKNTHKYIYEDVLEKELNGNHIHHINKNKFDNRLENLQEMTAEEHCKHHNIDITTKTNTSIRMKDKWKNDDYRKLALSGLKKWQTSDEGKLMMSETTSLVNKKRWKEDPEYAIKMASIFSKHASDMWKNVEWREWKRKKQSETMKLKFANDPSFIEKTKRVGTDNGRYKHIITTESILSQGINYNSLIEFSNSFDFKGLTFKNSQYRTQFITRRLK